MKAVLSSRGRSGKRMASRRGGDDGGSQRVETHGGERALRLAQRAAGREDVVADHDVHAPTASGQGP